MRPNVEKGQIWRKQIAVRADARWEYAYFLILDIRAGVSSAWEYELFPLTPDVDKTKCIGYAFPLNHHTGWQFMA